MPRKRPRKGAKKNADDDGGSDECPLLSLAHQVMTPIAAHLDGDDLSALARTCVAMRRLCDGPQGRIWWRDACVRLLGKTHCAVHLRAWGGPDGGYDDARLWRQLHRHASFPVSFSWHAGLGGSLWEGVQNKDEAARREALRRAEARLGPLEEYDEDVDWVEQDDDTSYTGAAILPRSDRARADVAERGPLAVAPQLSPDLARSGHTSTLIDELGLMVVVGGMMLVSMVAGDNEHPPAPPDFNGGNEGDVKVHAVRLPEMQVVAPDVMNWTSASEARDEEDPMSAKEPCEVPASRFRHQTIDASLPLGSRLSWNAFGDDGRGWGADGTDYSKGATLLVHGGYDGISRCFEKVYLLRVARDGSRCLWGDPGAPTNLVNGERMPRVFHHTLTRLRNSPRAISIGGQTDDDQRTQDDLANGAVHEMNLDTWTWTRRETNGWPARQVGEMDVTLTSRWLHIAALRPPRERRVYRNWTQWNRNYEKYYPAPVPRDTRVRKHSYDEAMAVMSHHMTKLEKAQGEQIVIVGGYDDSPDSAIGTMEPWVLDVESWTWHRSYWGPDNYESHTDVHGEFTMYIPEGRHRAGSCMIGQNLLLVHGGMGRSFMFGGINMLEESDSCVLDLTTLTWIHPDQGLHPRDSGLMFDDAWQSVRLRSVAGHTLEGMLAFGGCELGYMRQPTPIAKMDFLILGPTPGVGCALSPRNKLLYYAAAPIGKLQRDSWRSLFRTASERVSKYRVRGFHRIVIDGREQRVMLLEHRDGSKGGLVSVRHIGNHGSFCDERWSFWYEDSDSDFHSSSASDEDSD